MADSRIDSGIMNSVDSITKGGSARNREAEYAHVEEMVKKEYKLREKYQAELYKKQLQQAHNIRSAAGMDPKTWAEVAKNNPKDRQAQKEARDEYISNLRSIISDPEASKENRDLARRQLRTAERQERLAQKSVEALTKLSGSLQAAVDKQLTYMSSINTRLQGSQKEYSSIVKLISNGIGLNAYVTQSKVLEKLNSYVSEGIVYNVEQRAFLGTISDKIAATFEANNEALLQIIKIQQADSTAARLGMESTLTKFLNSNFADTSYLSGLSDNVAASILGANSQLSRDGSLAFEYQVQKWLGSMSSVGVSDSTIQSIAQGINALGTGDINSLSGNTSLQNLLVMAANTAGLNYSSLLSGGMNANTTNALMSGLVQYIQSIAGTSNQVVKSQYANLFGMTVSDLTSLLNLSSSDLVSISKNMLTYSDAISETEKGLSTIYQRVSAGEMAQNIFDNIMSNAATLVTGSTASYLTYLASNIVGDTMNNLLGETKVSPWGIGMSFKAGDLLKGGVAAAYTGVGLLSGIFNKHSYGLSLDGWNADEVNQNRGRGLLSTFADNNVGRTVSETVYIGNNDESALYKSSIMAADEQVNEVNGTSTQAETAESVSKISDITSDSIDPNVKAIRDILEMWDIMGIKMRTF